MKLSLKEPFFHSLLSTRLSNSKLIKKLQLIIILEMIHKIKCNNDWLIFSILTFLCPSIPGKFLFYEPSWNCCFCGINVLCLLPILRVESNRTNFELIFIQFLQFLLPFGIARIAKFWIKLNELGTNSNLTPPLSWATRYLLLTCLKHYMYFSRARKHYHNMFHL